MAETVSSWLSELTAKASGGGPAYGRVREPFSYTLGMPLSRSERFALKSGIAALSTVWVTITPDARQDGNYNQAHRAPRIARRKDQQ